MPHPVEMTFIRTEKQRKAISVRNATAIYARLHAQQERKLARRVAGLFAEQTAEVITNIRNNQFAAKAANNPVINLWMFDTIKGGTKFFSVLNEETLRSMRLAGWRTFAELHLSPDDFSTSTMAIQAHMTAHAVAATEQVIQTQVNLFSAVLEQAYLAGKTEEEIIAAAERVGKFAKRWRSVMIARTETTGALNFGDTEAAKQTGLIWGNEWVASLDALTRPDHIAVNGKTAALGERFEIVGGEYPGDPQMDLSQICNCRCFLLKIEKE